MSDDIVTRAREAVEKEACRPRKTHGVLWCDLHGEYFPTAYPTCAKYPAEWADLVDDLVDELEWKAVDHRRERDRLADELARGKAAKQVWESIARTYRRATIELTKEIMGMNVDKELMNKVESFLTGAGPDPCERSSFYDHWCDVHNARMPEGDDTCDTYRLVESLAEELFCNG